MLLTPDRSEKMKARIQAAVEDALRSRGISARRASIDVVGHDGLIRDIRAGRLPGIDRLEALFEYLGMDFHFGPRRSRIEHGFAEPAATADFVRPDAAPRGGYLPIDWHPEAPPPPGLPAAPVAFARAWLDQEGLKPEFLAAVIAEAPPDAAEVTALVEPLASRRGGPALWCCRQDGRLRLVRMQFEANATVIFASGPQGAAQVLAGDESGRVQVLGRVAWWGRREKAR